MSKLSDHFGDEGFAVPEDDGFGEGFALMPTGWYPVEISGVEIKRNSKDTGDLTIIEFTIFGEKFSNRKVWNGNGFNYPAHDISKTQAIGTSQFGRVLRACGWGTNERIQHEDELLGKQLDVYIETEPGTGGYKDRNIATKFRTLGSGGDEVKPAAKPVEAPIDVSSKAMAEGTTGEAPAPATGGFPWEK